MGVIFMEKKKMGRNQKMTHLHYFLTSNDLYEHTYPYTYTQPLGRGGVPNKRSILGSSHGKKFCLRILLEFACILCAESCRLQLMHWGSL